MIKTFILLFITVCNVFCFIEFKTTYIPNDSILNVSKLESYECGINFVDSIEVIHNECGSSNNYDISHRQPFGTRSYSLDVLYKNGEFNKDGSLKNYSVFENIKIENDLFKTISNNDTLCFKFNQIEGISIHPNRKSRMNGLLLTIGFFTITWVISIGVLALIANAIT